MTNSNFVKNQYYDLIFRDENKEKLTSYFLASRAVELEENHVNFGIFEVSMGKTIRVNPLFNSRGASLEYWDRVRPMVEISRDRVLIESEADKIILK